MSPFFGRHLETALAVVVLVWAVPDATLARQPVQDGSGGNRMVVVGVDEEGVVGAKVRVLRQSQADASPMAAILVDTESVAGGVVEPPVPQLPDLLVVVDHPQHLPFVASYPDSPPPSTVRLRSGLVASGKVVGGETEDGLGDAEICASWIDEHAPERFRRWQRCVASNEAGRFEIAGLATEGVMLTIAARGFAKATWQVDEAPLPVQFSLERVNEQASQVLTDAASADVVVEVIGWDGEPVKSFTMRVETVTAERRSGTAITVDQSTIPAKVEVPGRYLATGVVAVTFEAENHRRSPMAGLQLAAGGEVDMGAVFLESGAVVRGRIFDAVGSAPKTGCLVELLVSGAGEIHAQLLGIRPMTVSDETGDYLLGGLAEGRYRLRKRCYGMPATDRLVVLGDSEQLDLGEIWLHPGRRVLVRVNGLREGWLRVLDRFRDVSTPISEVPLVARSGHGAEAELLLAPGDYRFEAHDADGALSVSQEANVPSGGPGEVQTIRLEGMSRTIQSILTMNGRPVAGGTVLLGPVLDADRATGTIVINSQAGSAAPRSQIFRAGGGSQRTSVGDDGSFILEKAPQGLLWMTWYRPDGASMSRPWPNGPVGQFDLEGPRVTGVFLDRNGRPVDRGTVGLIGDLGREVSTATSLEDGRFELPPAPPGRYLLRGRSASAVGAIVEVNLGEEPPPPLVLRVPDLEPSHLELTLRRPSGGPAAGSWIHIVDAAGDTAGTGLSSGRGGFSRSGVPAGDLAVVWNDGAACVGGTSLTLEPGETERLDLALPTGRLIELRCPAEDCGGAFLSFLSVKNDSGVEIAGHLSGAPRGTLFSSEGTLGLGCLTPDRYELSFWTAGRRWTAEARISSVGQIETPVVVHGRPAGL